MNQQLGSEEAAAILNEGHIGNLGCITERGSYVVPVNYIFHDGDIYRDPDCTVDCLVCG